MVCYADAKQGGLRRDLTLAFEMDDAAEAANATLFNQQDGEFVGGTDKLASAHDYPAGAGLPRARHLFRERWDTGGPFSTFPDPNFPGRCLSSNEPTAMTRLGHLTGILQSPAGQPGGL